MTDDTPGSEPNPSEELPESHEAPENTEAVTEAPSDYEFADEAADEEAGEKPVKRSPVLPILAALGGVVLLGSVAWWQLSGGDTSVLPQLSKTLTSNIPGFPGAPKVAPAPAPLRQPPVIAEPVSPKTDSTTESVAQAPALVEAAPESVTTSKTLIENVPSPAPTAPVAPAPSATAMPKTTSDIDYRLEQLTARVDAFQKAIDQTSQQLSQLSAALASSPVTKTAPEASSKELQDKIARLEKQVDELSKAPPAAPAAPAVVQAPALTPAAPEAPAAAAPSETIVAPALEEKAPVAAPIKKTIKAATKAKKPAPVRKHWVLRSALPGQAWISENESSTDLKEIHVGDTVPGLGKVTAVEPVGDAWVVRGTRGSLE